MYLDTKMFSFIYLFILCTGFTITENKQPFNKLNLVWYKARRMDPLERIELCSNGYLV